nr:cytochrome b/b6 domain-containing protein [uncultured Undibacterium sp.]
MNTVSTSPASASDASQQTTTSHAELASHSKPDYVKVWDLPVRLIHWLIALCFTGAYLTAESESWRLLHVTLGYTMGGLIAFRVIWGVIGTRYARFSEFVRGPSAVFRYLRSLMTKTPEHFTGHNPAGAIAVLLLLGLGAAISVSGYALYNDLGGEWIEEVHELLANAMLAIVFIHIAAVLISSHLHKENLPLAMITGKKRRIASAAIASTWRSVALVILLAVIAFWVWQWQQAPTAQQTQRSDQISAADQAKSKTDED